MTILLTAVIMLSCKGVLAQLGEHLPYKQRVIGSSPIGPIYGGIAQLARAHGSYPWCHEFESLFRYFRDACRRLFFLFQQTMNSSRESHDEMVWQTRLQAGIPSAAKKGEKK